MPAATRRSGAGGGSTAADLKYLAEHFDPKSAGDFKMLAELRPDVVANYLTLRRAVRDSVVPGGLSAKYRELVILAIECAAMKTNPPPLRHARLAVEAGATSMEVADVVSLCILIRGMVTFAESGRYLLKAAIDHERKLARTKTRGAAKRTAARGAKRRS